MQVEVRCLDLKDDADLVWASYNTPLPRVGEGIIVTGQDCQLYEVVRLTHHLKTWHEKEGSFDKTVIWVKGKEGDK